MRYVVLASTTLSKLHEEADKLAQNGWKPHGSLVVAQISPQFDMEYFQPMIWEDPNPNAR